MLRQVHVIPPPSTYHQKTQGLETDMRLDDLCKTVAVFNRVPAYLGDEIAGLYACAGSR